MPLLLVLFLFVRVQYRVCLPPLDPKEQHSLAGEGVGGANSDDWIESLYTLWGVCCGGGATLSCG
jgi:hypothetical protein